MREFTVRNLKQGYIHGEIEPFCEVTGINIDEFEQAKGHEVYYLSDKEIDKLIEIGVFEDWIKERY